MRKALILAVTAAAALSACSDSKEPAEGMTPKEAVAQAGTMVKPSPGKYRTSVKLIDFELPGMPQGQMEQMRGMMEGGLAKGNEFCLTSDEADKGWEQMVDELADANCTFQKFDASGSRLDVQASCTGRDGKPSTMKLSGTTGATESSLLMEMEQQDSAFPGEGKMHMTMQMDSKRIGDCSS